MTAVTIPSFTGSPNERYPEGPKTFSVKSGQTVRGGRLVELTAAMECQEAGATSLKVLGIALNDADPTGAIGKVAAANEGVYDCVASGAITAGDSVMADSAGRVKTIVAVDNTNAGTVATGSINWRARVGIALEDIADGALGPIEFRLGV